MFFFSPTRYERKLSNDALAASASSHGIGSFVSVLHQVSAPLPRRGGAAPPLPTHHIRNAPLENGTLA